MKTLLIPVLILTLAGCNQQSAMDRHSAQANATKKVHTVDPDTVPESYSVYPAEVRLNIYRRDLLNQKCRGRFRGSREAACDGRAQLDKELLAKGWCFGGSDSPVTQHWLLCAQDYPGGEGWIASPVANDLTPER